MADTKTDMEKLLQQRYCGAMHRRLVSQLRGMRGAAHRVAELLAEQPAAVINMSIAEIAERCDTSPSTLLRLGRQLGYANFSELKGALATGAQTPPHPLAVETTSLFMTSLMDTFDCLDMAGVAEAARLIREARHVVVFGALLSASVAQMIGWGLRRLGIATLFSSDSEVAVNSLQSTDSLLLCVSHMGASPPVLRVLSFARRRDISIVMITNLADAPGCRHADLVLATNVTSVPNVGEDVFCRASGLLIGDLLLRAVEKSTSPSKASQVVQK